MKNIGYYIGAGLLSLMLSACGSDDSKGVDLQQLQKDIDADKKERGVTAVDTAKAVVQAPAAVVEPSAPERERVPELDRTRVYVMAKQFAEDHLGSADYGWGDDGFEDFGNGDYYVTGIADIPGKRIRWTVNIQYRGGEWTDKRQWTEKGWFAK